MKNPTNKVAMIALRLLAVVVLLGSLAGAWYAGRLQARMEAEHSPGVSVSVVSGARARIDTLKHRSADVLAAAVSPWTDQPQNAAYNKSNDKLQEAQLAQVQSELAASRREIEALRSENASLAGQNESNAKRMEALERSRQKERIDFDVAKNSTQNVAPGIAVTLQYTDPSTQRFSGYVKLKDEEHIVRILNQEARVPVVIYPKTGSEPIHLVVNQVNTPGVSGYLLLPPTGR